MSKAKPTPPKYPEHEKLKAREHDSRLLSEFYDFLILEQRWFIAEYVEGKFDSYMRPIHQRPNEIIGLFLGVDPKKLQAEKRAMLDEVRRADKERR